MEEKPKEESPTVVINSKDEKLRPYLPKNVQSSQLTFIDMHPLEVARQMTLIDHSIFSLIEPGELYKTAWAKGDKTKAPNVIELTERFNKVKSLQIQQTNLLTPYLIRYVSGLPPKSYPQRTPK